ncbi:MAG: AmmeMemoRadiSam system radical SAM enzyme [Candidatus Omnitrophota bacterium]
MLKEALLYDKLSDSKVQCILCRHNCTILPGEFGICGVRKNIDGKLYTYAFGSVIASHVDPVEKKPLYHFLPGSMSFSIATIGCNFKCSFCQNHEISQRSFKDGENEGYAMSPEEVAKEAKKNNCKSVSYTYTEPTIFFEYAYECSKLAKKAGLKNVFVTNGYMTEKALNMISPYLDACNVDLKSFNKGFYKNICGADLDGVLDSIRIMKKQGIWIEITTLVVTGENDSEKELKDVARFISSLDKNIPWHVSRYHPDYKYVKGGPTPIERLRLARSIGENAGLRYIYLGNVLEGGNTYCYNCRKLLVERETFSVREGYVRQNKCPNCSKEIEGRWQ